MTYATLMVHLELGQPNAALLQIAGDLAERFHAGVIGIAACQPMLIVYGDGYVSGEVFEQDREQIEKEINEAEAGFRSALHSRVGVLEWRSTVTFESLSDYFAREARSADLIITGVDLGASLLDNTRRVNISDLVMQVGRPVLTVPTAADKMKLERVVVGWKDTREARRAALDALPLLKTAAHVSIVEIAAEEDLAGARTHIEEVARWLKRHGVMAETFAVPSTGDDATRLNAIAQEHGADIIVAGAYGHSRLREWVLGGVTRNLLLRAELCSLVSH